MNCHQFYFLDFFSLSFFSFSFYSVSSDFFLVSSSLVFFPSVFPRKLEGELTNGTYVTDYLVNTIFRPRGSRLYSRFEMSLLVTSSRSFLSVSGRVPRDTGDLFFSSFLWVQHETTLTSVLYKSRSTRGYVGECLSLGLMQLVYIPLTLNELAWKVIFPASAFSSS